MTNLKPIIPDPKRHLRAMGQLTADAFSAGQYAGTPTETTTSATATTIGMFCGWPSTAGS